MKDFLKNSLIAFAGSTLLVGIWFFWQHPQILGWNFSLPYQGLAQMRIGQDNDKPGENTTGFPLTVPANFGIEIFAQDLTGARVMVFDGRGNLWVSRSRAGTITRLEVDDDRVISQEDVFRKLKTPHGLAIDPQNDTILYFAEEDKISRVGLYSQSQPRKVANLPLPAGGHTSRTIGFGPDGRLYAAAGSGCNVCLETDIRRAAIFSMRPDGSDYKRFAAGLRNTVFFTWHPQSGKMWGVDMGRDHLGDELPPEEINVIEQGKDYGWPICYGDNIHDTDFDQRQYLRNPCENKTAPHIQMPAHSAPLGLAFVPAGFGPADWENDLIVAFHGSWNRTEKTGYKLVRIKLDAAGNFEGQEDFIAGWLQDGEALGRPVGLLFHEGSLYVSDDKAGVVYKITYIGSD